MTNGSVLAPSDPRYVPNYGNVDTEPATQPTGAAKPATGTSSKPEKPTSATTKPATVPKPSKTPSDTAKPIVSKPTVSVSKPATSKPATPKPANAVPTPATTGNTATSDNASQPSVISFRAPSVLDGLVTYDSPDFDNYDWSAERRLPTAIFQKIDAKLDAFEKTLDSDRPNLQAKLAMLQDEIRARLKIATTQREIRILKYLQTEITIMQELYRRPR